MARANTSVRLSEARTYQRQIGVRVVEGRGSRVRTAEGDWLVDCLAGAGSLSLGHGHPVVTEAIQEVLAASAPLQLLDLDNPWLEAFAAEFLPTLPGQLADTAILHLCPPSGAAAVEAALTAAEIATGRSSHAALEGGFHGCTRGARAVSSNLVLRRSLPVSATTTRFMSFPETRTNPAGVGSDLSAALEHELTITRPAAVLVEAVQGEGGSRRVPDYWMRGLRRAVTNVGAVLVADEIQAGSGRTGRMWATEHSGVEPDMLVASKGLGAGLPFAVLAMRPDLDRWSAGTFTGTFRGNVLGFAVATAFLRFCRETDLLSRVSSLGAQLADELRRVTIDCDFIADVRGTGLMLGVTIVNPHAGVLGSSVLGPDPARALAVQQQCLKAGLLVEVGGVDGNVVRFLPPLTLSDDEADDLIQAFLLAIQAA